MPNITLRAISTREDWELLSRLRYQVFVDELGWRIPGATPDTMLDEMDRGAGGVLAFDGDTPIGSLAVKYPAGGPIPPSAMEQLALREFIDEVGPSQVVIAYKGFVADSHRKSGVFVQICQWIILEALQPETAFLFNEISPYLVTMYESLGFRRYAPDFAHDDMGIISIPMCLVLCDHEYLERIDSPLAASARARIRPNSAAVEHFRRRWEPTEPIRAAETSRARRFFEDWPNEAVARLIATAERVRFTRREVLIENGDTTNDLYLVQTGYLEVQVKSEADGRPLPIATLGPGDIVGEIPLLLGTPRTATVRAISEGEALRFSAKGIDRMMVEEPALAARFYRNLARLLAERLRSRALLITKAPPL